MLNYHKQDVLLMAAIAVASAGAGALANSYYEKRKAKNNLAKPDVAEASGGPMKFENASPEEAEAWRLFNSAWDSTEFVVSVPHAAINPITGCISPDFADIYRQMTTGEDPLPRWTAKGVDVLGRKFIVMQGDRRVGSFIYQEFIGDFSAIAVTSQSYKGDVSVASLQQYFQTAKYEVHKRDEIKKAREAEAEFEATRNSEPDMVVEPNVSMESVDLKQSTSEAPKVDVVDNTGPQLSVVNNQ